MTDLEMRVVNIVASASIGAAIELNKIVAQIEKTEYAPEQFPGLVYRIERPKASALIFATGKIICTGVKDMEEVKKAFSNVLKIIKKSGVKAKSLKIQIENIVVASRIGKKLDLPTLVSKLENAEYAPEQFPGLTYRMEEPKMKFLLFANGKLICTGAKDMRDIKTGIKKMRTKLKSLGVI